MVKRPRLRLVFTALILASAAKAASTIVQNPLPMVLSGPVPVTLAADDVAAGAACKTPEDLLQSVQQERDLLKTQQAAQDARNAKIALAQQALDAETQRLTELKTEIEGLLAKSDQAHTADVDRLVQLYQTMKPVDAAAIMNDMDIEVTVTVLATMKERNAAPIMAAMLPARARAVSKIILERAKLPGDQRPITVRLN